MTETYRKLVGNDYSRDFRSIAEIVESELVDPEDEEVLPDFWTGCTKFEPN